MPSFWGPSDEELMNARSHQFSANLDTSLSVDQPGKGDDSSDGSEVEDDEGMDDHIGHLFDLAETAHLADVYHTSEVPLLQEGLTPNNSPRKRSHL
jgi:hypothetical protein